MLNSQPVEKRVRSYAGFFDVHSIFYTIQGEGPFCGVPSVFVRLAGCNLQCPWCDTEYTQGRQQMDPPGVALAIARHLRPPGLIVITGGEPFRQPLGPLLTYLSDMGYYIQVETNGTLPPPTDGNLPFSVDPFERRGIYVVCSPKTGVVHPDIWKHACCAKYVLESESIADDDGLPLTALGHVANPRLARPPIWWQRPIYLQPADHKDETINQANTKAVVDSAMRHGYIVQLQIHKHLGME